MPSGRAFSTETAIPMFDNFSFIFQEDSCGSLPLNFLDTESGILIHNPLDEIKAITIPFRLSESELETIYQKAISPKFFEYPSEVRVRGEVPSTTFHLKIVNGILTNEVTWTDNLNFEPNFPENDKLIELFVLIQRIIHSNPAYPEPKSGCA